MPISHAKPKNYSALSLREKAEFIKKCCDEKEPLWQKTTLTLFGRNHSLYLGIICAISNYLKVYLTANNLASLLETERQRYRKYSDFEERVPSLEDCKISPLNERDLDVVYEIVNQYFQSNDDFYTFAIHKTLPVWTPDFHLDPNLNLSDGFGIYLTGILVFERGSDKKEIIRNVIAYKSKEKSALSALLGGCGALAFAGGNTGLTCLSFVVAAASRIRPRGCGELSDNIIAEEMRSPSPSL